MENAFGILKQSFKELLLKSDVHIIFLPDVILCCAILHNILMGQSHEEVEELLQILRSEGLDGAVVDEDVGAAEPTKAVRDDTAAVLGSQKRQDLGVFLSMQKRPLR